jgi:hypothetical protein
MELTAFVLLLTARVDVALESRADLGAKALLQAAEAYALHPKNKEGRWPATLADLLKPPFGGGPLLRNKEKDLMDPWGGLYRCRTEADEMTGRARFYVWTEREVNGKVRIYGRPPPALKK